MGEQAKVQNKESINKFTSTSEFGVIIALALLCIAMSFLSPYFLKSSNIINILYQVSQYAILAIGMGFVILTGGIDLSVGYTVGICGCMLASMISKGSNMWLTFIGVLLMGIFIGAVNGVLVTYMKLAPFIVTLGTGKIMQGLILLITNGMPISVNTPLNWLGNGKVGQIPVAVIIMALVIIIGTVFSKYTLSGRNIYAVGNNERSAKISGIKVERIKVLVYVIQGFLAALCGVIATGKLRSADSQLGNGYEMDVIAAVVIGGFSMSRGEGKIWSVMVGAAIMGVLKNAFVLLGLPSYWQTASIGIVIIIAVSIDPVKAFFKQRKINKGI